MLGAIIGDLAGSIYEYDQIKKVSNVTIDKIIEEDSFFSDDTILTIAIMDAILTKSSYEDKLKEWANKYINYLPDHKPYFKTTFSPGFTKWATSNVIGTSAGNGAMMRVSPVGYLFNTEEEVIENARLATIPSHNSKEAIEAATIVSLIIFYARNGYSKEEIINKLNLEIKEPNITTFNYTCMDTMDVCLYSLFNSTSFEDAIKLAISYGGDTDTNACIVGSMGEAIYGVDKKLKDKALSKLDKEMVSIINNAYKQNYKRK